MNCKAFIFNSISSKTHTSKSKNSQDDNTYPHQVIPISLLWVSIESSAALNATTGAISEMDNPFMTSAAPVPPSTPKCVTLNPSPNPINGHQLSYSPWLKDVLPFVEILDRWFGFLLIFSTCFQGAIVHWPNRIYCHSGSVTSVLENFNTLSLSHLTLVLLLPLSFPLWLILLSCTDCLFPYDLFLLSYTDHLCQHICKYPFL